MKAVYDLQNYWTSMTGPWFNPLICLTTDVFNEDNKFAFGQPRFIQVFNSFHLTVLSVVALPLKSWAVGFPVFSTITGFTFDRYCLDGFLFTLVLFRLVNGLRSFLPESFALLLCNLSSCDL